MRQLNLHGIIVVVTTRASIDGVSTAGNVAHFWAHTGLLVSIISTC